MENIITDQLSEVDLKIDDEAQTELSIASKWTKFISILMFVFCGFFLVFMLFGGASYVTMIKRTAAFGDLGSSSYGILIAIVVFVLSIIVTVYYFLYNFSAKTKLALQTDDEGLLNKAITSLKIFFAVTAIGSIISALLSIFSIINS